MNERQFTLLRELPQRGHVAWLVTARAFFDKAFLIFKNARFLRYFVSKI